MELSRYEKLKRFYPEVLKKEKELGRELSCNFDSIKKSYKEERTFCSKAFKKTHYSKGNTVVSVKTARKEGTQQFPVIPIPEKPKETLRQTVKTKENKGFFSFLACCLPKRSEIPTFKAEVKVNASPAKIVKVKKKIKIIETTEFESNRPGNKGYSSDDERNKHLSENEVTETVDFSRTNRICILHLATDISAVVNFLFKRGSNAVILLLSNSIGKETFIKDKMNFHYTLRSNIENILNSREVKLSLRQNGNVYSSEFALIGKMDSEGSVFLLSNPLKCPCILAQFFSDFVWGEGEDLSQLNRTVLEEGFYLADWHQHDTLIVDLSLIDNDAHELKAFIREICAIMEKNQYKQLKSVSLYSLFYNETLTSFIQELNRELSEIRVKTIFHH